MKTLIKIISIVLCCNLWYSNADLLISTFENPTGFQKVASVFFALTYSLISAMCIFNLKKMLPIVILALLDGICVYLRIGGKIGFFYGFYTTLLILVCFYLKKQSDKKIEIEKKVEKPIEPQIIEKPIEQEKQLEIPAAKKQEVEQGSEFAQQIALLSKRLNPAGTEKRMLIINEIENLELKNILLEKYNLN